MKPSCSNNTCSHYLQNDCVVKDGYYFRKDDSRLIARFKCNACGKRFSHATHSLEWRQKKRRVNQLLYKILASGVSMRRAAKILNINRTTVHRKLLYLAHKAKLEHNLFLQQLRNNPVEHLQFDDLITIEHTKLKPLSITIAIDVKRRYILGATIAKIPSFGHLAKLSVKKYGKRENEHNKKLHELHASLKPFILPTVIVETDEHKLYPPVVQKFYPQATHKQYKGGRGAVVGQGELKKLNYDPLFKINHTCAMFRANINRLIRKTWCTTKSPEMLQKHVDLYIHFHNSSLI